MKAEKKHLHNKITDVRHISDYIWRKYKRENCGSQEVRWQSADLLIQRPTTDELFPTLFIKIDSAYTLPNQLL